ncbi:sugar phosphate isomerase/epimerase family protein [Paenibacillus koleovorans]|uniref:sugar phosphate isomerase/epimerase family protein n=1 Tax=Paenibacillus koleovorans TaxID=121608 RepID=UPI000FDB3818|nr:sugar phosphate isomerase/epimerase [Paenibacillus koleovorans]
MARQLGILAHAFGQKPLSQLALEVGKAGFGTVQLALSKALSDIDCSTGRLSPGLGHHVAEAFDRNGVRIAVLGCYIDPIHPDSDERRRNVRRFKEHLKYARDFGCSVVATETGHLSTYMKDFPTDYHKKAWGILRHTVYELSEEAEKWGVTVGIEPAVSLVAQTPEEMRRLLEEVPSTALGVVLDGCNLLEAGNVDRQDEIFRTAFELFGDRIVSFHAKDARIRHGGARGKAALGAGDVNVPLFLSLAQQYKPFADITLEGVEGEMIAQSLDYWQQLWEVRV